MPHFLDTNILLYSVLPEPDETQKQAIAQELLDVDGITLSVQVLQEFYHQATRPSRPNRLSHDDAVRFLDSLPVETAQGLTLDLFRRATMLCRRYQISYWDAAIVAAAQASGCDLVYSEDLNDGQDYDGVTVVNPFTPTKV